MTERLSPGCFTNSVITFLSPSLTHQMFKENFNSIKFSLLRMEYRDEKDPDLMTEELTI